MSISGIGSYRAAQTQTARPAAQSADSALAPSEPKSKLSPPKTDRVEISGDYRRRFSETEEETLSDGESPSQMSVTKTPENEGASSDEEESQKVGSSIAINAAKMARKLAAAKTRSQVRAVIAEIQSDLKECESGKAQGMDVDEASVAAAERLLEAARRRMGQVEAREPTPQEELASDLASLL